MIRNIIKHKKRAAKTVVSEEGPSKVGRKMHRIASVEQPILAHTCVFT